MEICGYTVDEIEDEIADAEKNYEKFDSNELTKFLKNCFGMDDDGCNQYLDYLNSKKIKQLKDLEEKSLPGLTVAELITALEKIDDKSLPVCVDWVSGGCVSEITGVQRINVSPKHTYSKIHDKHYNNGVPVVYIF